jgi:hypothetical protein
MIRHAPLWARLLGVWVTAIGLAWLLLKLDGWFAGSDDFYWLVPMPGDLAAGARLLWEGLRTRPLTVSAVILVPTLAILASAGLVAAWAAPRLVRLTRRR